MILSHYPTLTKAFDLMVADNVASNLIVLAIHTKMANQSLEPVGIFDRAEAELSKLDEEALYELCCGAQDEPTCPKVSEDSEDVLNALFDMM